MKKAILLFVLLLSAIGFSQSINNYKYVIVPERFVFQDDNNQYNLNWLTKMMFEKYGFKVFYPNDILPADLAFDRCLALYADLEDSGFMRTNLVIKLKDCRNEVVFTSGEGSSKIKDRKKAYNEALRDASKDLDNLNYVYSGKDALSKKPDSQTQYELISATVAENPLTAQPINNGYQLVTITHQVVLRMYKTSQPDSYTAQGEGKSGVVFKKGSEWIFEYYENDRLVSEKLNIKF